MTPMHEFFSDGFWIFPIIMMTFMLVIVLLVLRAIFYRDPRFPGEGGGDKKPESPLEICKRRYAEGEITREEYEEIKKNLG